MSLGFLLNRLFERLACSGSGDLRGYKSSLALRKNIGCGLDLWNGYNHSGMGIFDIRSTSKQMGRRRNSLCRNCLFRSVIEPAINP